MYHTMKILIVEDERELSDSIAAYLGVENYLCEQAFTYADAKMKLGIYEYDCVLLDLMLPGGDGLDLLRYMRGRRNPAGVIIISAKDSLDDKVKGLGIGADDYLAKPYDLEVLAARVEARLRQENARNRYVSYGNLKLDTLSGCGYLNDRDLLLTQKEFSVLLLLTRNAENTVSRQEVLREIWNFETEDGNNALWTLISRLRKKLEAAGARLEISSKRGDGYMLELL